MHNRVFFFFFLVGMQEKQKSWTKVKSENKGGGDEWEELLLAPSLLSLPLLSSLQLSHFCCLRTPPQKKRICTLIIFSVSLVISFKITLELLSCKEMQHCDCWKAADPKLQLLHFWDLHMLVSTLLMLLAQALLEMSSFMFEQTANVRP